MARGQFAESSRVLAQLGREEAEFVVDAAEMIVASLEGGGTVYTCGNGGSAADAQHIAAELSGRYYLDRPGLAAVALTVNSSVVTAIGNDFGYEEVFARQLDGVGQEGDVLLAITTSGSSPNVARAVATAKEKGIRIIGLTGARGEEFAGSCDLSLVVPSRDVARIQEAHICSGHLICQLVEAAFFGDLSG